VGGWEVGIIFCLIRFPLQSSCLSSSGLKPLFSGVCGDQSCLGLLESDIFKIPELQNESLPPMLNYLNIPGIPFLGSSPTIVETTCHLCTFFADYGYKLGYEVCSLAIKSSTPEIQYQVLTLILASDQEGSKWLTFLKEQIPHWRRKAWIASMPSGLVVSAPTSAHIGMQKGQIEMGKHPAFEQLCSTLNHLWKRSAKRTKIQHPFRNEYINTAPI